MTNPQPDEIERVARALAKLVDGREDDWRDYEPEAETAIAAMQSASPATSDVVEALAALRREVAATEEHGDGAHDDSCPICLAIVKADAALNQSQQATPRDTLVEARDALQAMMDAWFDYHDAYSLTQPVTGAAGNAFDKALAARDNLDAALNQSQQAEGRE